MSLTRDRILAETRQTQELPSVPEVMLKLEEELGKPSPVIDRVTRIIEQDPSLSAAILKMANSSFFKGVSRVTSIKQAVMRMGLNQVRRIVLTGALINNYNSFAGKSPQLFWGHSLAVALATRAISNFSDVALEDSVLESAFTAGLLHDLGVMVMIHLFPDEFYDLTAFVLENGGLASDAEQEYWGIEHGEIGEVLARRWHLPEQICQVMRFHHRPWLADSEHRTLVQLVHLANFVCNNQGYSRHESGFPDSFDHGAWDALGLSLDQVPELIERVKTEGEWSTVFVETFGEIKKKNGSSAG